MDTYKRSIRGLQSRSNGEHFEGLIIAASRFYEEREIAAVDKTPEAFKVLKAMDRNRYRSRKPYANPYGWDSIQDWSWKH